MIADRIAQASKFKEEGNAFYIQKEYKQALSKYHRVFLYLNGLVDKEHELAQYSKQQINPQEQQQIQIIKQTTYLNMSQIYIYLQNWEKGQQASRNSNAIHNTAKGQYRLAICEMNLDNVDQARVAINQAVQLDKKLNVQDIVKEIDAREKKLDKNLQQAMKKMWV